MTLLLAPMEGLLDHSLREVLTRVPGIDRCVSEFIRVTGLLLPDRVFYRIVPELARGGCTSSGVPVRPQLLGSDAACLADNAARLAALGAPGVDLNFGCPAKIVNRHGGGAALLDDPELLAAILSAVRRAVPAGFPVSAKMRLGTRDDALAVTCAQALVAGGAQELVVHARTRDHGYRPPAYWDRVALIRAAVPVPVIANGEIWTVADAQRCRAESGGTALMLGRGQVADPGLALDLRQAALAPDAPPLAAPLLPWATVQTLLQGYFELVAARLVPRHQSGRIKQWLHYLRRRYPQADDAHARLRTVNDPQALADGLFGPGALVLPRRQPAAPAGERRTPAPPDLADCLP
jgi:tRNA-dihydrouridine synthase C